MAFKELTIKNLTINPCQLIGEEWMLITAGTEKSYNSMTASWGHIGALWGKHINGRPTVEIFVRPSRYTDSFIENNECFSLSFFTKEHQKDLSYMGSHSGRDEDKISKTRLTPIFIDEVPAFEEAKMIIIARKIYKSKINKEGFIDKSIIKAFYDTDSGHAYNNDSYHNVYIGEILKIMLKE
jgi:flavin reductase (DIM6/NTAB) family NADH-FMN oxidoreductase RutF